jgi:hypothetical protein
VKLNEKGFVTGGKREWKRAFELERFILPGLLSRNPGIFFGYPRFCVGSILSAGDVRLPVCVCAVSRFGGDFSGVRHVLTMIW